MTKKYLPADQERDFKALKRQIFKEKGFDCNQYRDNYSEFFRDTSVFEYFRRTVIPALIQDKRRKKQKIFFNGYA